MPDLQDRIQKTRRQKATDLHEKNRQVAENIVPAAVPLAYGYGRISHSNSEDGDSVPAQEDRVKRFFDLMLCHQVEWGGFYAEPKATSAFYKEFLSRPTATALMRILKPGDHLIVDKVDRLCRSARDFLNMMAMFRRDGISVHFVNMGGGTVSSGTPMGDFMLTVMAACAEWESAQLSERIMAGFKFKEAQGYWTKPRSPYGTRRVGRRGVPGTKHVNRFRLEWNWEERAIMSEIVRVIDEEGYGIRTAATHIKRFTAKIDESDLGARLHRSKRRKWFRMEVSRSYVMEKYFRLVEHPMQIDFERLKRVSITNLRKNGIDMSAIRELPSALKKSG